MRKILLSLLVVIIVVGGFLGWYVTRKPVSVFDNVAASEPSPDLVKQGEYVARLTDCVACHSIPDHKPFTGGLAMGSPVGTIYSTNITPDPDTGIGQYTLADFDRAIRRGVARDGHRLYPAMPYPSYTKLTDDDVKALYAFFMKSVEPANQPNPASVIPFPLNQRWPLELWNVAFLRSGTYVNKPEQDAMWNRGAYLLQGPGHCGACHTPRGVAINEKAYEESSPLYLSGGVLDGWYAPSLRHDQNVGLGRWSEDGIVQFLKNGRNAHAVVVGSMTEAYNNSTQYMTDDDLKAIAHYLKSLPGDPARDGTPWQPVATQASASLPEQKPGAQTYAAKCSFCHGVEGGGQAPWIPPLAGASSSLAPQGASQINVALNGSPRVVAQGMPDAYRMPSYREQMNDQQIADVLSYIRSSWGNNGPAVTAKDVADLRGKTGPAAANPIVLQMR